MPARANMHMHKPPLRLKNAPRCAPPPSQGTFDGTIEEQGAFVNEMGKIADAVVVRTPDTCPCVGPVHAVNAPMACGVFTHCSLLVMQVLVSMLAAKEESNEVWIERCKKLIELTPGVPLGLYECPMPYHRCATAPTPWASLLWRRCAAREEQ